MIKKTVAQLYDICLKQKLSFIFLAGELMCNIIFRRLLTSEQYIFIIIRSGKENKYFVQSYLRM